MLKYTIIIAVYNRIGEVKELLESAEKLDFEREKFEFLFVDDGSIDDFREFIENYKSVSGLQTRAIYQENMGPGEARNNGMRNAGGEYFIFVDSDCMFPPQWLRTIDSDVEKNGYEAFGGPDTCHESFSPLLKAITYSMTSKLGTGGTRGQKKSVGKFYPRSFNMGIHRKVFEDIGGMNKLRHGQDMDFSQRIYDAGYHVGLITDAFVYHKRRTSLSKFYRQIFNWGVARINLANAHPSMLKPVHLLPAMVVLGLILLLVFTIFFPTPGKFLWVLTAIGYFLITLWAIAESLIRYKNIKAALLSPVTLNIQVFAYGLGLLKALWQTKVLGRKEAEGFVKNYYSKKNLESR
ncbi:glycosyltransferase [uncultured Draconibacterium sp.]|uniref:glycosyltransferase n=1 Tax=uncultured Draconibacterium sp. TaxID=1573823 RepID=UPI0025EBFE81|nr:glycosyltransferase [uncultured Draconibacterium sp.]